MPGCFIGGMCPHLPRALLAVLAAAAALPAHAGCAATLEALQRLDAALPGTWQETSMSDGRPLVMSVSEAGGELFLAFQKTGEGLWATGQALVCRKGGALEARLSSARLGPAAPWLLQQVMHRSPVFVLRRSAAGELHVSTAGWSGVFVPQP